MMRFGVIVPNMPDVVLRRILDLLTYKELCRMECVCKRWRKLIAWLFKRDIHELTVEQSVTYSAICVHQQIPFKRLSVCCNFDAVDFLSGVLRRSRLHIRKLSCDLRFLADLDKLQCNREAHRRYWSNVEEVWLVVTKLNDEITEKFLSIESDLFLARFNLLELTVQIHETSVQADNINRVISSVVHRFPNVRISMELHASTCDEICEQLRTFSPMELNKLKLVCVAYEPTRMSLTRIAHHLEQRNIIVHNFSVRALTYADMCNCHVKNSLVVLEEIVVQGFLLPAKRAQFSPDWSIGCEPHESLFHNAVNTFRISSCNIENVDDLSLALLKTVTIGEMQHCDQHNHSSSDNNASNKPTIDGK
ncbi:putative F-box protein [Toxocara canis]|uniref:Putative F-box protein n=1 Tax=Toxocara canis TaxID=6265 RepID=A0A0B2VET1_TOXCA|nr:putative F-box protein [Toxocara canis]